MSRIRGLETKPEVKVRKFLFSKGFRFRKNVKSLPGSPDIVLRKFKTVVFVHGCFWHGHSCRAGKLPSTRIKFWKAKIAKNKVRDKVKESMLLTLGWNVQVVWQCEIKNNQLFISRMNRLIKSLKKGK